MECPNCGKQTIRVLSVESINIDPVRQKPVNTKGEAIFAIVGGGLIVLVFGGLSLLSIATNGSLGFTDTRWAMICSGFVVILALLLVYTIIVELPRVFRAVKMERKTYQCQFCQYKWTGEWIETHPTSASPGAAARRR